MKVLTIFVLALLFLVASVRSQITWNSCATSAATFQIGNVNISPQNPSVGDTISVNVTGNLKTGFQSATATLTVYFNGSPFPSIKQSICGLSPEVTCPAPAGPRTLSVSQPLPSFLPPGTYVGQAEIDDNAGNQVTCIKFTVNLAGVDDSQPALNDDSQPALNDDMIRAINSDPAGTWKAGRNARFEGLTLGDAKKLLGTKMDRALNVPKIIYESESIPSSFDSRTQWPGCVHPIRNQQQCGSCWAFGASESLSDRFCIASSGSVNVILSPQDLVSCDTANEGCNGGYLDLAWSYLTKTGIVVDSCFPYTSGSGTAPPCRKSCVNGNSWTPYKAKSGSVVQPSSVASMQSLIQTSGPIEAAFSVYQDFFSYTSGVYVHKSGSLAGGHAIKIIGWGVDTSSNQPYWIVANSWGTSWGMDGFFWILRGSDECGIEQSPIAGMPSVN